MAITVWDVLWRSSLSRVHGVSNRCTEGIRSSVVSQRRRAILLSWRLVVVWTFGSVWLGFTKSSAVAAWVSNCPDSN